MGRLVLATNRPSDLDEALLDRMDEVLLAPHTSGPRDVPRVGL